MKSVTKAFNKFKPDTFRIFYNSGYQTFIIHRVLADRQHPLQPLEARKHNQRKKEGLWWHVTTGLELSKSSVIRSWCRRRLRNAFTEALNTRGFDRFGRLIDVGALKGSFNGLANILKDRPDFQLTGSFRLHVLVPLIPAKYVTVQRDTIKVIDLMLSCYQDEMQRKFPVRKPDREPMGTTHAGRTESLRDANPSRKQRML